MVGENGQGLNRKAVKSCEQATGASRGYEGTPGMNTPTNRATKWRHSHKSFTTYVVLLLDSNRRFLSVTYVYHCVATTWQITASRLRHLAYS